MEFLRLLHLLGVNHFRQFLSVIRTLVIPTFRCAVVDCYTRRTKAKENPSSFASDTKFGETFSKFINELKFFTAVLKNFDLQVQQLSLCYNYRCLDFQI